MQALFGTRAAALVCATAALVACGGGGSGGGGSPVVGDSAASSTTVGTITGFGSIFVNGIEFDTDDARLRIDDEDGVDDSVLALGMKVRVIGTVDGDRRRGHADSVYYDDDIEGPIDAGSVVLVDVATKTFAVFGLTVRADVSGTVFDDGASFDSLAEGQRVEVSGFFDGDQLVATRIERQSDADDEHELKGIVRSYDGHSVELELLNGASVGPFAIRDDALLEIPAQPVGSFVEVRLIRWGDGLVVAGIEAEDDDLVDDDAKEGELSIRGILTSNGSGGLLVGGMPLAVDAGTEYEPASLRGNLVAGLELKAEGRLEGGVLRADHIEAERGDNELGGRLVSLTIDDAKTGLVVIDLGDGETIVIATNSGTTFEDDSELDLDGDDSFDLDELRPGSDYLDVEAYASLSGQLVATRIERQD